MESNSNLYKSAILKIKKMENKDNQLPKALPTDAGQTQETKSKMFISQLKANYKFWLIPLLIVGGYYTYKKYKNKF